MSAITKERYYFHSGYFENMPPPLKIEARFKEEKEKYLNQALDIIRKEVKTKNIGQDLIELNPETLDKVNTLFRLTNLNNLNSYEEMFSTLKNDFSCEPVLYNLGKERITAISDRLTLNRIVFTWKKL